MSDNPVVSLRIGGNSSSVSIDGIPIPYLTNLSLSHPAHEMPHLSLDVALAEPFDLTFPASVAIDFHAVQPMTLVDVSNSDEGTHVLARFGVENILSFEDLDSIARGQKRISTETDELVRELLDIINRLAGVELSEPFRDLSASFPPQPYNGEDMVGDDAPLQTLAREWEDAAPEIEQSKDSADSEEPV